MNAVIDFIETVMKGHWLATACEVIGVTSLDDTIEIPAKATPSQKLAFIESITKKVVDRMGLIIGRFCILWLWDIRH